MGGINSDTVKAPVFSFEKLIQVDPFLGPEMKSTGEVMGVDKKFSHALYKALLAAGFKIPVEGNVLVSVADKDKEETLPIVEEYSKLGFNIQATQDTAKFLQKHGLASEQVGESEDSTNQLIRSGSVQIVINTPTKGKIPNRLGFKLRRTASEFKIPCITSLDTAKAILDIIRFLKAGETIKSISMEEFTSHIKKEAN